MESMSGFTLFRIRNVSVKLHVSLIFLLLYVILVSSFQFPIVAKMSGVAPESLFLGPFASSILFALALLISIFVHEMGHVLMAQAHGYKAQAITLMMLGGVSQIEEIPEKPWDELKVALIGPFVSLAIAGILFEIRILSDSPDIDFFCYWIGQTNLVLGIFNLIPAFPTDGGRVLRSVFSMSQGRLKGTQSAVAVSRVCAWILGILGALQLNILLMILALFLYSAAKSELFILMAQTVLKGLKIRDLTEGSALRIPEDASVAAAAALMVQGQRLWIVSEKKDGGWAILSADQISKIPAQLRETIRVANIHAEFGKPANADDELSDVAPYLLQGRFKAIPVRDQSGYVGVIQTSKILEMIQLKQLAWEEKSVETWHPQARHLPMP